MEAVAESDRSHDWFAKVGKVLGKICNKLILLCCFDLAKPTLRWLSFSIVAATLTLLQFALHVWQFLRNPKPLTKEVVIHEGILTFNYLYPSLILSWRCIIIQMRVGWVKKELGHWPRIFQGFLRFFNQWPFLSKGPFSSGHKKDDASLLIMMMQRW